MRSDCKRMKVNAYGINGKEFRISTNYNVNECTEIVGNCGCVHAEIDLLSKMNPTIIYVTHSPCLDCAIAIVEAGVNRVVYNKEYRLSAGLDYLLINGISVKKEKFD